jgi:protein SCO1
MTKLWKISMLLLLLAIPAMAYIFLQLFGENRYDLPLYHESGVDVDSECVFAEGQHHINIQSAPVLSSLWNRENPHNDILVISFLSSDCDDVCQLKFNQLSRVANFFSSIQVISLVYEHKPMPVLKKQLMSGLNSNWKFVTEEAADLEKFVLCELVLPFEVKSMHQFVLVDKEKRIRGYYNGLDVTEVDRLITEIRVLLNNYKYEEHEQSNS